jgi:hypothetical protein
VTKGRGGGKFEFSQEIMGSFLLCSRTMTSLV